MLIIPTAFHWLLSSLSLVRRTSLIHFSGSVDGSAALVIRGRFQQKQIENVLRRYIRELYMLDITHEIQVST